MDGSHLDESIMIVRCFAIVALFSTVLAPGCRSKIREDLDYSYSVQQTWPLDELDFGEIVQFESVFWEPDDTVSLRELIVNDSIASGRTVLEIGTGTGLISILCLQNGAKSVVATDINPAAVANAKYNAAMLADDGALEVRQVSKESPHVFSVIGDDETFDLIISNPPWEDRVATEPSEYAFYDEDFVLMDSLLDGLPQHLNPGGRCLLAYGHVPAIERLLEAATQRGYETKILDDRDLRKLPTDFLPGMLIEVRPPLKADKVDSGAFVSGPDESAPDDSAREATSDATVDTKATAQP